MLGKKLRMSSEHTVCTDLTDSDSYFDFDDLVEDEDGSNGDHDPPIPVRRLTDDRHIIEGTHEEARTFHACTTIWTPLGISLVAALTYMAIPIRPSGTINYYLTLLQWFIWSAACGLGTSTYLDAVAPVARPRFLILTTLCGSLSCPVFFLVRGLCRGMDLSYDHGNLGYGYVSDPHPLHLPPQLTTTPLTHSYCR